MKGRPGSVLAPPCPAPSGSGHWLSRGELCALGHLSPRLVRGQLSLRSSPTPSSPCLPAPAGFPTVGRARAGWRDIPAHLASPFLPVSACAWGVQLMTAHVLGAGGRRSSCRHCGRPCCPSGRPRRSCTGRPGGRPPARARGGGRGGRLYRPEAHGSMRELGLGASERALQTVGLNGMSSQFNRNWARDFEGRGLNLSSPRVDPKVCGGRWQLRGGSIGSSPSLAPSGAAGQVSRQGGPKSHTLCPWWVGTIWATTGGAEQYPHHAGLQSGLRDSLAGDPALSHLSPHLYKMELMAKHLEQWVRQEAEPLRHPESVWALLSLWLLSGS